jgi:DNA (cytosine-5)-methyltransferase 1
MGDENVVALDLFCGSGAVTEGLKAEGFTVLAAVELDHVSCRTYQLNHPEVHLEPMDIRAVSPAQLRSRTGHQGRIDLLVVCAPCQPFSSQNRKRAHDDPRALLVLESVKFISEFNPYLVLYENVRGILNTGTMTLLDNQLADLGYLLAPPKVIDAADYGVPQRRERCITVAAKERGLAESFYNALELKPRVSVAEAIGSLTPLAAGERDPDDSLHFARCHQPIVLERLRRIPKDGGSRSSLPEYLELPCHKERPTDFSDVYGRMKWDDVAPTLTTGCTDLTKGRFAHPRDDRAITLREAALLQSFPARYRFFGNHGQIAQQIGNAVPVKMVRTMARSLIECIKLARAQERTTSRAKP